MSLESLPSPRRIITGIGADGRSYVEEDGPPPPPLSVPERPGYKNWNLWRTENSPAEIGSKIAVEEQKGILPPPRGTLIRIIDFPPLPEDPAEQRRQAFATFSRMYPDARHLADH